MTGRKVLLYSQGIFLREIPFTSSQVHSFGRWTPHKLQGRTWKTWGLGKKRHSDSDKPKQPRCGHHLSSPLPTHMCRVFGEGRAQALRFRRSVLEGKRSDEGPSRRAACPLVFLLEFYYLLFTKSWVRTRGCKWVRSMRFGHTRSVERKR